MSPVASTQPLSWWTYAQLTCGKGCFWAAWWTGKPTLKQWRTPDAVGMATHRSEVFAAYLPAVQRALAVEPQAICIAVSFARAAMREAEDKPVAPGAAEEGELDPNANSKTISAALKAKLRALYKGKAVSVAARAEVADALALEAVAQRGPVPLKATPGRTRHIGLLTRDGKDAGKVATLGIVMEKAGEAAGYYLATQEGKRPKYIMCCDCLPGSKTRMIPVPKTGFIPKRCKDHVVQRTRERQRAKSERVYLTNPEKQRRRVAKWTADNLEKARNKKAEWRNKHPEKMREYKTLYNERQRAKKKDP